ncbi:caspase-8-like isoform X2 [Protopterus annectens]|uniref:caspase-8-like isoform X2 n=1 Tax=Protopterus annectens TaxID=7888 RepID=UPI001CFBBBFC|nr:caspase-8-like isoform X2 [Protopterus annectens]
MAFCPVICELDQHLNGENVAALKFLCMDLIPQKDLESISNGMDLFLKLNENGVLVDKGCFILRELLYRVKRLDLLTVIGATINEVKNELSIPNRAVISSYRQLLHDITESMSSHDVKHAKFLLPGNFRKCTWEDTVTMREVFIKMEKLDLLAENNMEHLKTICRNIRSDLIRKIEAYERHQGACSRETTFFSPVMEVGENQMDAVYRMRSRPLGYCIIINNRNFHDETKIRRGAEADLVSLQKVFKKLHFTVECHNDLTADKIRMAVKSYQNDIHKRRDCFICCILSHGDKGTVYGVDGKRVPIRDITSCFTGQQCPSLIGKPKIFFIQACQGEKTQYGVPLETDFLDVDLVETDAAPVIDSVAEWADFLIGMSTMEDYESFRHRSKGSLYIQALCMNLEKKSSQTSPSCSQ